MLCLDLLGIGHVRDDAPKHRGVDEARADRVCTDTRRPVVTGQVLGEQHHGALRGVVRAAALAPFEALDARDRDDGSAALGEHGREDGLRREERACDVDVLHQLPRVEGHGVHESTARDARRGDHRVYAPELRHDVGRRGELPGFVAHIEHMEISRRRRRHDLGPLVGGVQIGAHHHRAFGREPRGACKADTRGGTGDIGDLALQATHGCSFARSTGQP